MIIQHEVCASFSCIRKCTYIAIYAHDVRGLLNMVPYKQLFKVAIYKCDAGAPKWHELQRLNEGPERFLRLQVPPGLIVKSLFLGKANDLQIVLYIRFSAAMASLTGTVVTGCYRSIWRRLYLRMFGCRVDEPWMSCPTRRSISSNCKSLT